MVFKNPFTYRNRLSKDLHQQRDSIQKWLVEKTTNQLYQELQTIRKTPEYIHHELSFKQQRNSKILKNKDKQRLLEEQVIFDYMNYGLYTIPFLNANIAKSIQKNPNFNTKSLSFSNLTTLDSEAATILSQHNHLITFPWRALKGNSEVLKAFRIHNNEIIFSHVWNLSVDDVLDLLSVEEDQALSNGFIVFRDISNLSLEAAKILADYSGPIALDIANLTPEVAKILSTNSSILISPEQSRILVQRFKNE